MPIYEYRCDNGHTFEVLQRMSDAPLSNCTACEARVQRVFHPVAVHFKGSGFYSTDYRKKPVTTSDDGKGKPGSEDSGSSTDSSDGAKPVSKTGDSGSKAGSGASESKPSKSSA